MALKIALLTLLIPVASAFAGPAIRVDSNGNVSIMAKPGQSAPFLVLTSSTGEQVGKLGTDGTFWVKSLSISDDVENETLPYSITVSTDGLPTLNSAATSYFDGDVIVTGQLISDSSKANAIWVRQGGIHMLDSDPDGAVPPGQLTAKKVKTSTMSLQGTILEFLDGAGVQISSMTGTTLNVSSIESDEVRGKIKSSNGGAAAPVDGDCDEADEEGTIYSSRSPSRMYFCLGDGAGGWEWRYTNLSP